MEADLVRMRRTNLQAFGGLMIVSIVDKLQRQENVFKTLPFLARGEGDNVSDVL